MKLARIFDMDWIKDRLKEPTSYLAFGVGGVAIGIIASWPLLIWASIVGAGVGFILKEKGVL